MDQQRVINRHIAQNKRLVVSLALGFAAAVFIPVFLILVLITQSPLALFPALIVAISWTLIAAMKADGCVLDLADVRDASPETEPRLFNVVSGLRAALGLAPVDLYVVDDPAMNALATGKDPNNGSLVVTSGLLENLELVELEAVIALQLYKIKTHETAPQMFVVPTFGSSLVLAESVDSIAPLATFLRLPTPWVDAVLLRISSARRDLERDVEAMSYTRYPPALADALEKISGKSALGVAAPVTAHLWLAPAVAPSANPYIAKLHAPIADRVAVLQEL